MVTSKEMEGKYEWQIICDFWTKSISDVDLLNNLSWLDDGWPLFQKGIYSSEIYEDDTDPHFGVPRES